MLNLKRITMAVQPSVYYITSELTGASVSKRIKTYALVKKQMASMLKESDNNEVEVIRERRGEWGEWFERWSLVNGKPKIIKQTWL